MTVKVKMTVELRPWEVPRFARLAMPPRPKQDGLQEAPAIPVAELQPEALDALASAWLDALYAQAKRASPFMLNVSVR